MFEQAFKNIDDALWKESGCTTELDYTEQTSWLLFLKYLDALEQNKERPSSLLHQFLVNSPNKRVNLTAGSSVELVCGGGRLPLTLDGPAVIRAKDRPAHQTESH